MAAPVKHTCPDIDKVIKAIRRVIRSSEDGSKDAENAIDYCKDIRSELDGLESMLEELRESNAGLRRWGTLLQEELDSMEAQRDNLQDELDQLTVNN